VKYALLPILWTSLAVLAEDGAELNQPAGEVPTDTATADQDVANEVTKGVRVEDVVEPTADYHYAQFGKGDPFVPPLTLSPEKKSVAVINASGMEIPIVSPLQRFAITDLNLTGIWQLSNGERKGMVMTPQGGQESGLGIIVRVGDPIGKRGGRVIAIAGDYLTVREFSLAPDGTRQYEDQQMYMGRWTSGLEVNGKIKFKPGAKDADLEIKAEPGAPLDFAQPEKKADVVQGAQPVGGEEPAPPVNGEKADAAGVNAEKADAAGVNAEKAVKAPADAENK